MRATLNAARSKCGASVVPASASAMRRKSLPVVIEIRPRSDLRLVLRPLAHERLVDLLGAYRCGVGAQARDAALEGGTLLHDALAYAPVEVHADIHFCGGEGVADKVLAVGERRLEHREHVGQAAET